jgi:DNA-directed RNA polymerase sigma subunit (sigma70/sigma32)
MVNRLVRTSRRMLLELHREPTAEELARKLSIPVEQVHRLLNRASYLPLLQIGGNPGKTAPNRLKT